ncbi:MAG TPA: hypothetical protein VMN78_13795 [Longimicrobiales bacterium]|nr:hypothetical protein [Longimicrobiales bacterium]
MTRNTQIPLDGRYVVVFTLISFLSYGAHELIHHLVARATCGAWGSMTFSTFALATGCEPTGTVLVATLAGPALTYVLMYAGAALILGGRPLAGVTLVLANLPLARLVTVLMRGGDEMVLGRAWIGGGAAWPVMLALTLLLLAPPAVLAYRAIGNRYRPALFAALLVLPLFIDMALKRVLLARILESWPSAIAGVPLLFLVAMALAAAALLALLRARPWRVAGTAELAARPPV